MSTLTLQLPRTLPVIQHQTAVVPYCRTHRAYSVCALSLTTLQMWSDADRLLLSVTPTILRELSRIMSGSGGGRVLKFLRLLPRKRTSLDLDLFSLRLLWSRDRCAVLLKIEQSILLVIIVFDVSLVLRSTSVMHLVWTVVFI